MPPLRVAHVVATAGRSGVESHLLALLPAFDRSEVEPRLFVPGPGPLVDALAARGVTVLPGAPTRKLAWGELRALAARLRGACDVLHAHGPRAAFWAAAAARLARVPCFVCTVHELRWRSLPPGPRRELWVAFESWAMHRADRLIVLSRDSQAGLEQRMPDLAPRLVRIPGSTPLLEAEAGIARARPGEPGRPLRIISVGRLEQVKRFDRILDAVAIATGRGVEVELRVAGDGPLRPALLEHTHATGLESRVHWLGARSDVPALLADAHVFVNASLSEVFPLATLEAMAAGLPVVTTDNGGGRELVEDGACGIVVPTNVDPDAARGLAEALIALAADPVRRASLGTAGAARAREQFSPAGMARATAAVYREAARR